MISFFKKWQAPLVVLVVMTAAMTGCKIGGKNDKTRAPRSIARNVTFVTKLNNVASKAYAFGTTAALHTASTPKVNGTVNAKATHAGTAATFTGGTWTYVPTGGRAAKFVYTVKTATGAFKANATYTFNLIFKNSNSGVLQLTIKPDPAKSTVVRTNGTFEFKTAKVK